MTHPGMEGVVDEFEPRRQITAQEIKDLRKALGRTQEELARLIGATSMSVFRWETGRSAPIPSYQEKLKKLQEWVRGQGGKG